MEKIDEKLKILKPILGEKKIHSLRHMYFVEDDYRAKREIENHVDFLISRLVKQDVTDEIILPPPPRELCGGELCTGEIEYLDKKLYPFHLALQDINRHAGIFGATGSGKTTWAKLLIGTLYNKRIPFLIFDWEKSYRNLIRSYPDVQVFTVGNDINPLFLNFLTVPPGIEREEYIKSVIAIISEDYIGGIGADTMLLKYMEMAYQETQDPFFDDLKQIVTREISKDMGRKGRLSGRSGLWKESVSRQIAFLSKGAAGNVINPRKHHPLEELFNRPIVLEFGNLKSPYDRKFFIHVILNWLAIYNQHCGIHSEHLKQVLVFEEFHNIVMKGREDNMVSTLFREARKYGIGLVAIDQTPSEIPNAIFANMNVKISFALGTSKDISAMAKAMNLDHERSRYLGMLKTGQAIIHVKQRYQDPFLIRPPFIEQEENIWDEELRAAMKDLAGCIKPNEPAFEISSTPHTPQDSENLSPLEKVLLADIIERPLEGVDERTKRLGIHPSIISALHSALSDRGLITPVIIDKKKLLEVTDHGKAVAETLGIAIPRMETRGGLEHTYWIHQTVQFLKKHVFQPVCEVDGIDIVDTKAGIAIEIETGKSDVAANLAKLDNSRIPMCFMLATNKAAEIKIQNQSKSFPSIHVLPVKDLLKLTKDQLTVIPLHPQQ